MEYGNKEAVHSKPCKTSKMEHFAKIVKRLLAVHYCTKVPSLMFERVPNIFLKIFEERFTIKLRLYGLRYKMERFVKIVNGFRPLTIFAKFSILSI